MSTNTEFICEVVRVTSLTPHPNADRLEFVGFETAAGPSAYQVISQRGGFKPGDLAVYLGVDSLIPRRDPRFDFLFERLDGKGKDEFRLRAARIRGHYSEGLLVPLAPLEPHVVGASMAEALGVRQYTPPERSAPTPAGGGTSTKDPTLGGLFPVYGVDSLRKVPDLFKEGEEVLFTEKIHGTNMRAGWLPVGFLGRHRFVVGSHRVVKTPTRGRLRRAWDWLRGRRNPGWYGTDIWTVAAREHNIEGRLAAHPGIVAYFELYGRTKEGARIQDLTYGDATLGLTLIDAYDSDTGTWLSWHELVGLSKVLGIPTPPVFHRAFWENLDAHKWLAEGESFLAPEQIREGFVARTVDSPRRGKWVGQGYLMRADG